VGWGQGLECSEAEAEKRETTFPGPKARTCPRPHPSSAQKMAKGQSVGPPPTLWLHSPQPQGLSTSLDCLSRAMYSWYSRRSPCGTYTLYCLPHVSRNAVSALTAAILQTVGRGGAGRGRGGDAWERAGMGRSKGTWTQAGRQAAGGCTGFPGCWHPTHLCAVTPDTCALASYSSFPMKVTS
jgi:hypothetical protein